MSEEPYKPGIAYAPDDPRWPHNQPDYRIWTDHASTVLVRFWQGSGVMEVATRDDRNHVWGPPVPVVEER